MREDSLRALVETRVHRPGAIAEGLPGFHDVGLDAPEPWEPRPAQVEAAR